MPNFSLPDTAFEEAASRFPTPFHLYDARGIRQTVRDLNAAFSWNEGFKEYYAVKALPNPHILSLLIEEGCGLDCASEVELLLAQRVNCRDIMFSANAMPPHEFAMARAMGAIINLDDISDIETLRDNGGVGDTVCLRFNPGGTFGGDSDIIGSPGQSKYGMTAPQILEALKTLKALGVTGFGIHALLASNSSNREYYPNLAALLFQTGLEAEKETGVRLTFVNLSGGVGIPYRPEDKKVDIRAVAESVREKYVACFGTRSDIAIKAELGRYVTGPHGWLITRAMHLKQIHKTYLGVDACAADLLRPAMYGAYHHISVVGKRGKPDDTLYDVTGSLCENNDKFAIDRRLPKVDMGDILVIHDTGAHGFSMGYQYNGRLRSKEILLQDDGTLKMIRRAETPDDYFATLL
ncbi:MAG: diaminopimelate decarboxylase [Eubacteriales bacterium]|nr:diaminopimelate decarboxylase [Eubacteriales bacterium]MDD4104908.1 diaminopimelate decarboxylase [Eubacteriales bacterium]MDD4710062.1 diaminopimelate decarboxylase [Eubacteriales bacterium]